MARCCEWRAKEFRRAETRAAAARRRAAEPRDTTTPVGMVRLLEAFNTREAFASADPRPLLGNDPGYLAAALPKDAKIWQAAGADLHLAKPLHPVQLVEALALARRG